MSENVAVFVYTASQYGFGIVHDYGQLWKQRGCLTSNGTPIKNWQYVADLLKKVKLLIGEEEMVFQTTSFQKLKLPNE